jgi:NAD(P)-dependent dehydrogenase (short-subunit alcohol dehydrogenase family)
LNPRELFDISGRPAVITGATGALGRAASLALAAMGAKLTLAAGTRSALDELAGEVRALGADVRAVALRPDNIENAEAIARAAADAFGGIDILISASGTNLPNPIGKMPVEDWDAVMDANVRGSWLMCRAVGAHMLRQDRGGKVVLISSVRGRHGSPLGYSSYCPSKAAIDGLVRALALEWGPNRINVNGIGPTVFRSKLTAWMFDDEKTGGQANVPALKRIPLGRLGEPEDLIGALIYLISPASDFCTGQILYVDGGYTAG